MYTELVELEELEQMEKLFLYLAQTRLLLRDIEKLIGLKIPTENIAGLSQIRKHLLNLLNKVKADNNAIQHLDNRKRIVQTEAVIIALVQDVITTDVLTKKLSLSV
jgi:hypothetical protein